MPVFLSSTGSTSQDSLWKAFGALGVKPRVVAIVCLGLLNWIEPAGAQGTKTYSLTVGRHHSVSMSDEKADKILAEASKVLHKCNVVLKRNGPVRTFESSHTPATIRNRATRDAVFREDFDVKVVKLFIRFCRVRQTGQVGCAWDPPPPPAEQLPRHRSIIVADLPDPDIELAGKIWAHEFGHRTGLPHRDDRNALMACKVKDAEIDQEECDCFRGGPGSCDREPEPATQCAIP
jgi:hypothetical protein